MGEPEPFEDPAHPLNGEAYRTGKKCVEGCGRPAGTAWSPYWCQPCNALRMNRISSGLAAIAANLAGKETPHA